MAGSAKTGVVHSQPIQLEDLLRYRRVPSAGLYVAVTQKCPMSCAHCSTNSSPTSPFAPSEEELRQFVSSISDQPPRYVLFTGGEPLIRPHLLAELSDIIHLNGAHVYVITGGFWAPKPSRPIKRALQRIDLLTFSYDQYHAPEVPFAALLEAMRSAEALGVSLAVQTVKNPQEPEFTDSLLKSIGDAFDGRVPVYVSELSYHGRASNLAQGGSPSIPYHAPCMISTWPVVSYTGAIVACCQHSVIDNPDPPAHLLLGRLGSSTWREVALRNTERLSLRAVRTLGPAALGPCNGPYCRSCLSYTSDDHQRVADTFNAMNGSLRERLLQVPGLIPTVQIERPVAHG